MANPINHSFPQHKLDVYNVAVEMAVHAKKISDAVPRGHRNLVDQLLRAATSVVLNVSEGANRMSPGMKRQRYTEARGECGEVATAVELLVAFGLCTPRDAEQLLHLASRVGQMLTRLVRRFS